VDVGGPRLAGGSDRHVIRFSVAEKWADSPIAEPAREYDHRDMTTSLMTSASLEAVRGELARLRRSSRVEIEQRLRDARSYGDGSNNDEHHAVREDQMVLEARIAALDAAVARATVVDPSDGVRGGAGIGSTVTIEDLQSGAITRHQLASAHSRGQDVISAASPIGQALMGAVPGMAVTVELPNGRSRGVRLLDVTSSNGYP
jgi:transcription elongation factor GreA